MPGPSGTFVKLPDVRGFELKKQLDTVHPHRKDVSYVVVVMFESGLPMIASRLSSLAYQ